MKKETHSQGRGASKIIIMLGRVSSDGGPRWMKRARKQKEGADASSAVRLGGHPSGPSGLRYPGWSSGFSFLMFPVDFIRLHLAGGSV